MKPGLFQRGRRSTVLAAVQRASVVMLLWVAMASLAQAQDPTLRFGGRIPPEVDAIYQRGLAWLASTQGADGHWKGGNEGCGRGRHLPDGVSRERGGPELRPLRRDDPARPFARSSQRQEEKTGYLPSSMYHHGFGYARAVRGVWFGGRKSLLWEGNKPVPHHRQDARPGDPLHGGFAKEKSLGRAGGTPRMRPTRIRPSPGPC